MSINRFRNFYTPVCDCCEKELPAEESFMEAVEAKRRAGWKTSRDTDGEWVDLCPECAKAEKMSK